MAPPVRFYRVGRHSCAVLGTGEDALHSYGSNQGYVLGDSAALVIDSGFDTRVAFRVLQRIRKRVRSVSVLDTHYHSDHIFGSSIFSDIGAPIIAQEKCTRSIRKHSQILLDAYRKRNTQLARLLQGVEVAYPNISYESRLVNHLADKLEATIVHPRGRAHTDGDSIVNIAQEHVVFAGDVLWVGYHPNLEDSDIQGQIHALRLILRMKPRRIVPGHGPVSGPREVKRFIKYLEELDRNIRSGLKKNLRDDELVRHVIPRWSWDWKMRWLLRSYIKGLARKN